MQFCVICSILVLSLNISKIDVVEKNNNDP